MSSWPRGIGAITLFVEDLEAAKRFYREVFGLPVMFADDNSAVFDFGNTIVHLSNRRREVGPLPRRPGYAARCRCWRSRRRLTRPATARVRSVCLARWGRSA